MTDEELEREAAILGYRREACPRRHAGSAAVDPDMNLPNGWRIEDPCPDCRGSRRMWSRPGLAAWLNDVDVRELIERTRERGE